MSAGSFSWMPPKSHRGALLSTRPAAFQLPVLFEDRISSCHTIFPNLTMAPHWPRDKDVKPLAKPVSPRMAWTRPLLMLTTPRLALRAPTSSAAGPFSTPRGAAPSWTALRSQLAPQLPRVQRKVWTWRSGQMVHSITSFKTPQFVLTYLCCYSTHDLHCWKSLHNVCLGLQLSYFPLLHMSIFLSILVLVIVSLL
jgi:hypothetical protein